jgi:hypothetical protein
VHLRSVCAWFAHPFVPGPDCGLVYPVLSSRARACRRNHQVPRVPLPELGVTLIRETCTPPPGTLLPVPGSYGLIRQSPVALPYFGVSPRSRSLCRLLPAPAATRTFPTLSLRIFPWMPEPIPRRFAECPLPGSSSAFIGLPHHSIGSASRLSPRIRFSTGRLSRLQLFRFVQASKFARLPDRSYRSKFPCRAAEALYIRAERVSLPSHASDMLSARLQAIGGTRTFTSQDSQPCRLLTNDADVSTVPLSVGSRTDAKLLSSDLSVAPRFLWECLTNRIVSWFSAPAASNRACPFRALGFLACFLSRFMRPIGLERLSVVARTQDRLLARDDHDTAVSPSPIREESVS